MKRIYCLLICLITAVSLIGLSGCKKQQRQNVGTRGTLIITSTPSKADVIIGNTKQGVTPLTRKNVLARSYIVKLTKPGYQSEWRKITVRGGKAYPINIALQPMHASVLLVSKPNHVKIYIDNAFRGETPLILKRLPLGKYAARVEQAGFSTREISWTLDSPRPKKITVSLTSNVAKVTVDSMPKECQVFVDETPSGVTPLNLVLEEGKHQIRLEKPGYALLEKSIVVARGKKYKKKFELKQLPGGLNITTTPADATVYINNHSYGNSPVKVDGLPIGKYTIRVTKNNYDTRQAILVVAPGRITHKSFTLSRNTGGMDLIVNPPGTTIYINGKACGMSEADADGVNAKIFKIRGLRAGEYVVKIAHKRGHPTSRTYTIKVRKGKIFRREEPMKLWVPNAELKLTGGRIFRGILIYESKDKAKIMFSPEPGISELFDRSEVISLKPIKDDDE